MHCQRLPPTREVTTTTGGCKSSKQWRSASPATYRKRSSGARGHGCRHAGNRGGALARREARTGHAGGLAMCQAAAATAGSPNAAPTLLKVRLTGATRLCGELVRVAGAAEQAAQSVLAKMNCVSPPPNGILPLMQILVVCMSLALLQPCCRARKIPLTPASAST